MEDEIVCMLTNKKERLAKFQVPLNKSPILAVKRYFVFCFCNLGFLRKVKKDFRRRQNIIKRSEFGSNTEQRKESSNIGWSGWRTDKIDDMNRAKWRDLCLARWSTRSKEDGLVKFDQHTW